MLHRHASTTLLTLLILLSVISGGLLVQAQSAAPQATPYSVALPLVAIDPPPTTGTPRPTPNPLQIMATYDTPRATTALIGPEGGSLTATGADGTTYQLIIPATALEYTTTLTLTPAQYVSGLPFAAGSLGTVLIEPTGLTLLIPATLTMNPASMPDTAQPYAFAFEADGKELHLHPSVGASLLRAASTSVVTVASQRLGGYGVTSATSAELAQQAYHAPTSFADWIAQEAARSPTSNRKIDVSVAAITHYIETELEPAVRNPALAEHAAASFVRVSNLLTQYDLQGLGSLYLLGRDTFLTVIQRGTEAAHARCLTQQRPSEGATIARLIRYLKQAFPQAATATAQSLLNRCLTFELKVTSLLTEQGAVFTRQITMQASALLAAEGTTTRLTGQGMAQVTASNWQGQRPCETYTIELATSQFIARDRGLGLYLTPNQPGNGSAELIYGFGAGLQALYKFRCQTPAGIVPIDTALPWDAYYDLMHLSDRITIDQLAYRTRAQGIDIDRFTGWVYHDTQDLGDVTITEDTQIELIHRPQTL